MLDVWNDQRDDNLLDGGAHFYDTYECADGKWLAVGAIEPQFHTVLVKRLGLGEDRISRANGSRQLARVFETDRRCDPDAQRVTTG